MTKSILVVAALIASAAYAAQASAANHNASRHAAAMAAKSTDCVRAPNVGAFATAPFTQPPCMPGTMR